MRHRLLALVFVFVMVATASASAKAPGKWDQLSLTQKRAAVAASIRHDRSAIHWWLALRAPAPRPTRALELVGVKTVWCPAIGVRAPVVICDRGVHLRHALKLLTLLDAKIEARKAAASWARADESVDLAIRLAAPVFGASENTLTTIVGREGGNVNPRTLAADLCSGRQPGWNNTGSDAFGAFQFMLDSKPACGSESAWGTFDAYDDAAFAAAWARGVKVPYRYMTPASNLGQAIVAAYMVANPGLTDGGIGHWCASMCR